MINQIEYESLFIEEYPKIPKRIRTFSQGNHQRSLIGKQWFYYGESDEEYTLYKDVIVQEAPQYVLIDMYANGERINAHPVAIEKSQLKKQYPVQKLFPYPMSDKDAKRKLRDYFIRKGTFNDQ